MKKITLLLMLLTVSFGFSQVVLEDFEGTPELVGFEGLGGANVVADPVDATNTVGELIVVDAGQPWQGANLVMQSNYIDVSTPATQQVQVDVYSTSAFTMLARLADAQGAAVESAADAAHGGTGWETLTYTFNENLDGTMSANGEYGRIAFFPNWNGAGWHDPEIERTVYIDNLTAFAGAALSTCGNGVQDGDETGVDCGGSCDPCVTAPATAAPTPPARAAADVVSIYSDAYSNITVGTYDAGWCGVAITEVMIAGDNTFRKNTGIPCQGIDFSANRQDLSTFTHLHFDFYITDADLVGDVFNVKLVDFAGGGGEASALEVNINTGTTPALVANTWVSVDVDITAIGGVVAGSTTRSDIAQIGITTANVSNVWYDNIYLHKGTTLSTDEFTKAEFKAYPNPTTDTWNIVSSTENIEAIEVYDMIGKQVLALEPKTKEASIDASQLNTGIYFAKVRSSLGENTVRLIKK